jgi:cytoskeletal protein CcmA (bactofilin family)
MFSRKRSETEDRQMAESSDDLGIPMKPARPVVAPTAMTPIRQPMMPPRTPDMARPADPPHPVDAPRSADSPRLGDGLRRPNEFAQPVRQNGEARRLSVGPEITLSGEINCCDKLFIEGSVEANLNNCREVEIAETGLFKGSASIDEAEIRGRFEGNLVVRKRLLIRAAGRVSGTIRYGQIEIECGGQISGDIQVQPAVDAGEATAGLMPVRVAS